MRDYLFYWLLSIAAMLLYFLKGIPVSEILAPAVIVGLGFVIKNLESLKK